MSAEDESTPLTRVTTYDEGVHLLFAGFPTRQEAINWGKNEFDTGIEFIPTPFGSLDNLPFAIVDPAFITIEELTESWVPGTHVKTTFINYYENFAIAFPYGETGEWAVLVTADIEYQTPSGPRAPKS